jgi:hypothetical protein
VAPFLQIQFFLPGPVSTQSDSGEQLELNSHANLSEVVRERGEGRGRGKREEGRGKREEGRG